MKHSDDMDGGRGYGVIDRERVFADLSLQEADLARRRALLLISSMFSSPASPLFSPSINACRSVTIFCSCSSSKRRLARTTSLAEP